MLMRDFYCTVNCLFIYLFILCIHTSRFHYNLTLVFIRFLVKGIDDVALYSKAREILIIMGEYFQIQDDYLGKQKRESERWRRRRRKKGNQRGGGVGKVTRKRGENGGAERKEKERRRGRK